MFLQYMFLIVVALSLLGQRDTSVRVEHVEAPAHPVNTLSTGVVVVEVEIVRASGNVQTRVLYGEPPFVASALKALQQWRFVATPEADISRTSVTFLFRSPTIYSAKIGAMAIRPWDFDRDFPALPQEMIDPGYPPTSLATGAAILEVRVNASGVVTGTRTVEGVRPLSDQALGAVKNWRFSPAMTLGRATPSTVFVVISYVLPM